MNKQNTKILFFFSLILVNILLTAPFALPFPQFPYMALTGTVQIDGINATIGTVIKAYIQNDSDPDEADGNHTVITPGEYSLLITNVSSDEQGKVINFTVGNYTAYQTSVYTPGGGVFLNLTVDNIEPQTSFIVPVSGQNVSGNLFINISARDAVTGIQTLKIQKGTGGNWISLPLESGTINDGYYNITLDSTQLQNGLTNITINATDFVGNSNATVYQTIMIDNLNPSVIINAPTTTNYAGIITFNATVQDILSGVQTVYFNVTNTVSPVIVNLETTEGNYYNTTFNTLLLDDGEHTATVYAYDYAGNLNNSVSITFTVENINEAPTISSYYPAFNPKIADLTAQLFNITALDVDIGDNITTTWYFDGNYVETGTSYTTDPLLAGNYNITVIVNDTKNAFDSHYWNLTVSTTPLSDKYIGTILSQTNLTNATNVTVNHTTYGGIDFGNQSLNLDDVVDLDNYINISNGIVGIDTENLPALNKSATITMKGLAYTRTPLIYYNLGFTLTGNNICTVCHNISYNASTGILVFNVDHFSIYWTTTNTSNQPPVITSTPKTTAIENVAYSYDVDATDADNDTLTYSLITYPNGMSISSTTGLISWTPTLDGMYNVTVSVADNNDSTTQSFNITVSEGAKLAIVDLEIKVDSKTQKNLDSGDKIKDVKPGSEIKFRVEVKNLYDEDIEDVEIEDIDVEVIIESIDDGDDLEEESDEFDLDAEETETVKLNFKAPLEVDEDTYDVTIKVEGEYENGTKLDAEWNLILELEKDKHDIIIHKAVLDPTTVECARTASLNIDLVNIGSTDEDEVVLEVKNKDLDLNIIEKNIELEEGTNDNKFENSYTIEVGDNVEPGTYPITITSLYDTDKESDKKTVELTVSECITVVKKEKVTFEKVSKKVLTPKLMPSKKKITKQPTKTTGIKFENVTFTETDEYLILMAILFLLLSGLFILTAAFAIIQIKKGKRV